MRRLAVIFMLLLSCVLWAQEPRFVGYGPAQGLASSSVYAVTQDAEGYLWVGTRGGLFRFDGERFEAFNDGLPALRVTSLAVDKDNRLWVGTTAGLAVRFPDSDIRATHEMTENRYIRALEVDREGYVWAATKDSVLVRMGIKDGKVADHSRLRYIIGDFEGDYPVQDLLSDPKGRLWLAGRLVPAQVLDISHPKDPEKVPGWWNTGSFAWHQGQLWAYEDYYSALLRYDEAAQTFVNMGKLPVAHAALLSDNRGRLWAAGTYGLCLVNIEDPAASTVYKPASNELYCIFQDRQGNIWVGGDNGLSVLSPALQQVQTVSTAQVSALMEDSRGKLWIGTKEERISALYEDREGAVYVGYWNNTGFDIYKDGKKMHGKISGPVPREQWTVAEGDRITSNWISDFLEGSDGRFWVVSWEGVGLNEWDRSTGLTLPPEWLSPFKYPSADKDSSIYLSSRLGSRIIEDTHGNLIYGTTEAGVNIIDKDTRLVTKYFRGNSSIPDDYVTDLCPAPDGTVWVATRGGLWRFPDSASGSARNNKKTTPSLQSAPLSSRPSEESGEISYLQGKLVQSVEADDSGRIWAGTEDGLYFIDTDGSIGRVPKELGFPSDIYGEHVSCRLSDGRLAFGGSSGAVAFHPDSLLSIQAKGNLPLAPMVQHRYRISEGDWVSGRFPGILEHMAPGRYVLEEQSSDLFGRWDRGETTVRTIRVPLPLGLRWPFIVLYLLVGAAAVWTFIRLRERRLLVKELDMRNRLFSIISHDLRNPVSANRLLSRELLQNVEKLPPDKLREGLKELNQSADSTCSLLENLLLWSLNQKGMLEPVMRDENLLSLSAEAIETIQRKEIITLDIAPEHVVKTDRNMLLTCLRNLLDNAVKASSSTVILRSEATKDLLRTRKITIIDDGPGLKDNTPEYGHGLGLAITRELLDKMGASMTESNRPEGGLEITITL